MFRGTLNRSVWITGMNQGSSKKSSKRWGQRTVREENRIGSVDYCQRRAFSAIEMEATGASWTNKEHDLMLC